MHKGTNKLVKSQQIAPYLPGISIPSPKLDTIGTSGIIGTWEKELKSRYIVNNQVKEIERYLYNKKPGKGQSWTDLHASNWHLNKSVAILNQCGKNYLANKESNGTYTYIHSFHCKKKYCPRCANKKRSILLAKFASFFTGEAGAKLMKEYDLAIFTVTLRHNSHTRTGWYFQELKTQFRNALKYGAFKKYLKGGIYNTEVTYSKVSGFHIHRHAVVLIPKEYNFRNGVVGNWSSDSKKFVWIDRTIPQELRKFWHQKTGDSYQVDLTPINDKDLVGNLLEVFKYVGKPGKNEEGDRVIPAQVVEQLEKNNREKFSNRFGLLYKVKELSINFKELEEIPEDKPNYENLVIVSDLYKKGSEIAFKDETNLPKVEDWTTYLKSINESANVNRLRELERLQGESLIRSSIFSNNSVCSPPTNEVPLFIPYGLSPGNGATETPSVPVVFTIF